MDESQQPPPPSESEATAVFRSDEPATELVRILDGYLDDLQAGRSPSKEQLLAANPHLAGQLEACLAGMEFIHHAARPTDGPSQLGDFRIIRELGRGGMGVVYEAEQVSLGRRVALKVLRFGGASDPEAMQRFEHEAQTVARLHHTNIVPIFAVGCERGVHYYAMQYIEGRSLAGVHSPRPSPQDVARWGLESAEALDHAHARGVIHRDVKPSNLLLDMEGRVWLTDFGLARRDDEVTLTVTGALLGTPRYMSPEQATAVKHPIDHRTDLYSLGATLYELATGRPVFEGDTPHGVITQILNTEPVPPRRVRPDLPRDLETVILKCLAKEPARRYATARDMAEDLRSCLLGRAIQARRPNMVERAARWAAKNRRTAGIAAASVAASIVTMVAVVWGTSAYRESKLGRLMLATNDTKLVAEVLYPDRDEPVIPKFTLPTQQPVALPEGEYRIRFTEHGQLSDVYRAVVNAGQEQKAQVTLTGRQMFEPVAVESPFFTFDTPHGADVFLPTMRGLRRFYGRSMTEAPPIELDIDDKSLLMHGVVWNGILHSGWSYHGYRWDVVKPGPDLDGDKHPDLVLYSNMQSAVLAFSGKTGKKLWLSIEVPKQKAVASYADGTIVGAPAWADIDADGTLDAIVARICAGDTTDTKQDIPTPRRTVEALSGRTGTSLWRRPLADALFAVAAGENAPYEARWFVNSGSNNSGQNSPSATNNFTASWNDRTDQSFPATYPPQIIGEAVWLGVGRRLVRLDLKTGDDVGAGHDLGFWPIRPPQYADLDGDGAIDVLALESPEAEKLRLHAFALSSVSAREGEAPAEPTSGEAKPARREPRPPKLASPLWLAEFTGRWAHDYTAPAPRWPVVADLDGDGKAEVIVSTGGFVDLAPDETPDNMTRRWAGILVFDGATGTMRWQQQLITSHEDNTWAMQPVDEILIGPDINGDGVRDVFTAAINAATPSASADSAWHYSFWMYFDALGGKDGSRIWNHAWELNRDQWIEPGDTRPLEWGLAGGDGLPTLMTAFSPLYAPASPDMLLMLETSTGRVAHYGEGLKHPQVADLDHDGLVDLLAMDLPDRSHTYRGKLRTIRGMAPDAWRFLGELKTAADFDRDGTTDFITKTAQFSAISGRTGRPIWRVDGNRDTYQKAEWFPALPDGDLDGDGTSDLLTWREARAYSQSKPENIDPVAPLQAISGRTGALLWSCRELARVNAFTTAVVRDLDGDGAAEVIVVAATDWDVVHPPGKLIGGEDWRLWLAVLNGRDGTTKWKTPLSATNAFGRQWPAQDSGLEPAAVDLNGDGVLDLVAAAIVSETGCELRALDGKTGTLLWKQAMSDRAARQFLLNEFPMPIVGDLDGDGKPEIVVLDTTFDRDKKLTEQLYLGNDTLVCLDGPSGQVRWRWRSDYESLSYGQTYFAGKRLVKPVPLLVNLHGDNRRAVCIWSSHAKTVTLVGHDGKLLEQRTLKRSQLYDGMPFRAWAADLDDDGRDEIVLHTDGKILATTGGLTKEKWAWDVQDYGEVMDVVRLRKDGPWNVVVDKNWLLQGLDGATGKLRWGCDFPSRQSRVVYDPQPILPGAIADALPQVVFKNTEGVMVCRQTLAMTDGGKFQWSAHAPSTPLKAEFDPRNLRPLPWARHANWRDGTFRLFYYTGAIVPFLIAWLFRPTRRRLAWMIGRAAVISLVWAAVALAIDRETMSSAERYSLLGAPAFVVYGLTLEVYWQILKGLWWLARRAWNATFKRPAKCPPRAS